MSNPYFVATLSSNEVYRNRDRTRCVTDDLDSIEDRIQYVETNKSDVTHIHNNYAPISHTHSEYAPVSHTHPEYASADDIRCTVTNVSQANEDLNDSKFRPDRSVWDGKMFLCDIPRFYGANLADVSTEKRIIKPLYIHDTKIVGHAANNQDSRNDVVLRAVYEF